MVEEYDLDKNGKLDEEERAIYLEDRRRKMEDEDAKRDAQTKYDLVCFVRYGTISYGYFSMYSYWNGNSRNVNS